MRYRWTFCNEWNGKEWIPDDTIPGKDGWFEDVPKRIYIGTPWIFVTIARSFGDGMRLKIPFGRYTRIPTLLSIEKRRPEVPLMPRRGQVRMIVDALDVHDPAIDAALEWDEPGLALIIAVDLLSGPKGGPRKEHPSIPLEVRHEIDMILNAKKSTLTKNQKWKLKMLMRGLSTILTLRRPLTVPDPPIAPDSEPAGHELYLAWMGDEPPPCSWEFMSEAYRERWDKLATKLENDPDLVRFLYYANPANRQPAGPGRRRTGGDECSTET